MDTAKRGEHATQAVKGSRFRQIRWVESTGSTNTDLMQLAAQGEAEGLVLVADYQSSGRGRRQRVWEAPPGASLLFSMLLRPDHLAERAALVTMAAGIASVEACRVTARVETTLKWPNDMLLEGKKLSGMLSETLVVGGEITAIVIGIGINANWPTDLPTELAETATSLNFHMPSSEPIDREALVVSLLLSMDELLDLLETKEGQALLLERYKGHLSTLGREVRVELADGTFIGLAHDVDSAGRLLVKNEAEERWVSVADVVHLR